MVAKVEPLLTIADLDAMPDDENCYELIEGELFVSRAPSLIHQRIVRNAIVAFENYLARNPIGEVLPGPGVIFSDFSGVIPDVAYISNERHKELASGDRIIGAPDLIIEILSPGAENARRDRHAKRQLYRKYGVKEYWIIDPESPTIEIFRTTRFRLVATLGLTDEITTPLLPGFRCSVEALLR